MEHEIKEEEFLDALKAGISRTTDLIARLTEYHGGQVRTEYIMTGDIAREFVERGYEVKVECLNRNLVNGMTALRSARPFKLLRSKRTDVALVESSLIPLALVEVKIGAKKFSRVKGDLDKITTTMAMMKAGMAAKAIGAVVLEMHVPQTRKRYLESHFSDAVATLEQAFAEDLAVYAGKRAGFQFSFHSLQNEGAGIQGRAVDDLGYGPEWAEDGHATRYYAIIIRSTRPVPPPPRNYAEYKASLME